MPVSCHSHPRRPPEGNNGECLGTTGSPSHSEPGHPATACRARRIRPERAGGCELRAASPPAPTAPHRHSPQLPPRPGAGQGGIPGRRSNRHPAAAPEPAGRTRNGNPKGHHPRGGVLGNQAGPHRTPRLPLQGAASLQTPRPPTWRWQRGNMT